MMLEKLINTFINATKEKTTKRGVEWIMADFIYCVYILILLGGMVAFISFDVWYALLFVAVSFMLVMSGWGWFAFQLRKTLLTLLYPPVEKTDENGDSMLSGEFELLNETLKNMMENIKELKEDV